MSSQFKCDLFVDSLMEKIAEKQVTRLRLEFEPGQRRDLEEREDHDQGAARAINRRGEGGTVTMKREVHSEYIQEHPGESKNVTDM